MSKIHNMFRLVGQPGTDEFEVPAGMELVNALYLGVATPEEQNAYIQQGVPGGQYKVLYVLKPIVTELRDFVRVPNVNPEQVRRGRPPKNE